VEEPKAADGEEVTSGDPPPEAGREKEKEHEEKEAGLQAWHVMKQF